MTIAERPLVSIVTPSYNGAEYVEETILSVLKQDYPRIEYLFMDGGSTDGTLEIVKRYESRMYWESSPDAGQADAINRGFRRASGDILAWLNTDDVLVGGAISTIVRYFERHPAAKFVYGDAFAIDEHDRTFGIRAHVRQTNFAELLLKGDYIIQPAAFWRRDLWSQIGELDKDLRYALDYDYWMRVAKHHTLHYIPVCLAKERLIVDAKTFRGGIERLEEIEAVARKHGAAGMPTSFRAEAASWHIRFGVGRLFRRERGSLNDFKRAFRLRPGILSFIRFFGALLIFGPRGIPRMALQLNRIQSRRFKRAVRVPDPAFQPNFD